MIVDFKRNDEEGRALALERYQVLDTKKEPAFENVVKLVRDVLKVPICAVSLVDRDRLWFKAQRGLPSNELPRQQTFCNMAIEGDEPFVVRDAEKDPDFHNCPLVLGPPHIRAYAGIPLRSPDGYNVGALCAIDTEPRKFPAAEIEILKNFASIVMDELELRQAVSSDHLTGTLSRRAWTERAELEVSRALRYDRPISLAMLDIDRFKTVNDRFGHPAGDVVIRDIAERCLNLIRLSDFCGRLGGEEFAIMMPETRLDAAYSVTERIRASFQDALIDIGTDSPVSCTVSVGVTELAPGEKELAPFLARADRALYQAKHDGRNRVEAA